MRKLRTLFATLAFLASPAMAQADDPTVLWAAPDPEMAAAFENANDTLDLFLDNTLDRRGIAPDHDNLKIAVPVNAAGIANELIWVSQIHRISDTDFEGRLDNTPQNITGKHYQSRITFTRDQIRDWGHLSFDGKLYGHYTTRLLLTSLPREKALEILQILSPDPVPANWKTR
ncbi:DUF2314 domain-containing protein [Profundibacter sp.]